MEKLRAVALLSIGRAVGFSGFAIFTLMFGLSFDPVLAFRCGGVLLLILLAALLLKAHRAPLTNYRETEAWVLLRQEDRPDEHVASEAMPAVLRQAYLIFARWTAGAAAVVWICAMLLSLAGLGGGQHV